VKITLFGWLLVFLGGVDVAVVAVVTLIRSLSVSAFVWTGGQTAWAIAGGAAIVLGVIVFVAGIFNAMRSDW
jgi:hypothetical protein